MLSTPSNKLAQAILTWTIKRRPPNYDFAYNNLYLVFSNELIRRSKLVKVSEMCAAALSLFIFCEHVTAGHELYNSQTESLEKS